MSTMRAAWIAGLLVVVFLAGWLLGARYEAAKITPRKPELRLGEHNFGYRLINPLLACDAAHNTIDDNELKPFRRKVEQFINSRKSQHAVSHVSVHFREMNNGLSFSINGEDKFSPASLLKLPYLVAYLKWEEFEPGLLKRRFTYDKTMQDFNARQNFKPSQTMERGRSYSVEDLLFRSIALSDNNAHAILSRNISPDILHRAYNDLGLSVPEIRDGEQEMTVREYAAFFRILFNASYLTRDLSEKALQFLAEPDFQVGIVAGIPPNIVTAQKYGERVLGNHQELKQLHDCGIVYYPNHPYLLCIMTRGSSFDPLVDTIRDISRLVYEEVDQQYKN